MIPNLIDFILNIDTNLILLIQAYGIYIYPIIFLIFFCETGLVVTPFLPGDSLLFAAGALASRNLLSLGILFALICCAVLLGDNVNYAIGRFLGPRVFKQNSRWFKREYLMKTHAFYQKHGIKTIILARFIPIMRTFSPFVAGIGNMYYPKFLLYDIIGGLAWISLFLFGGFFFGNLPIIKDNFSLMIIAIVIVSVIPLAIEVIKSLKENSKNNSA